MTSSIFIEPVIFLLRPLTAPNTLFVDRDGVLNHVVIRGDELSSPQSLEEFQIAEDIDALASQEIRGDWNLVMISNQPDLSRGILDMDLLKRFHEQIAERVFFNAIYLCPHVASDKCGCRKPSTGLIQRFKQDYPHIKGREYFIGDRLSDLGCANNLNIPFVLRRRHYNGDLIKSSQFVIENLYEIKALLRKEN